MRLCSSAPGKLVLLGEYAVLFGHPAVVMAVNRRAGVRMEAAEGPEWTVEAPGFEDGPVAFRLDREGGFLWNEPDGAAAARLALVERVAGGLVDSKALDPRLLESAKLTLDTREFFHRTPSGTTKLGLGSSAALTVALAEALRMWIAEDARPDAFTLRDLLDLHRSIQGGSGSGIDLSASHGGGVVEYRLIEEGRQPSARPLVLPDGLHLVFVWTGRSASTGQFLSRLDEGLQTDNGVITGVLDDLGQLSARGITFLRAGDTASFLRTVNEFGRAMERLGHAAEIPILSDEHAALGRLARDLPVTYKPSGAGGGDVGIAFTDDPDAAAAFRTKTGGEGFSCLDLHVDSRGLETAPDLHNSTFILHT